MAKIVAMLKFSTQSSNGLLQNCPGFHITLCATFNRTWAAFLLRQGGTMAISKQLRFEVFKRDGFRCAYCGRTPPAVMLEADHIIPKSTGGLDDINNLLTSCFDCNRGKRDIPLDKIPSKLQENLEILKEKEQQLIEYQRLIRKIENRLQKQINNIEQVFRDGFHTTRSFTESFRRSVKYFLQRLTESEITEAMQLTIGRFNPKSIRELNKTLSYFCGICWHKIKEK